MLQPERPRILQDLLKEFLNRVHVMVMSESFGEHRHHTVTITGYAELCSITFRFEAFHSPSLVSVCVGISEEPNLAIS